MEQERVIPSGPEPASGARRRRRATRSVLAASTAAGFVGLVIAGGCASKVAERYRGEPVGNQGGAWEVAFEGPAASEAREGMDPTGAWEYARRDGALNIQTPGPIDASAEWPEPDRPDLDYYRRIWFSRRAEEFIYFGPGPYRGYESRRWDGRTWVR